LVAVASALLIVGVAWTWGPAASVSRQGPAGGTVSARAVGPVSFGASPGQVRAWAGPPDYTSDTISYWPIPHHDKQAYVIGYDCKGQVIEGKRSSCDTLFGFRHNKLTAFKTDSPAFRLPNGVRPGMTAVQFRSKEPRAANIAGCPTVRRLPAAAGTSLYVSFHEFVNPPFTGPTLLVTLYASSGDPAFTLATKLKRIQLCG
jgi:hypothetical protein